MIPSIKSEEMESALEGLLGFDRRLTIRSNRCAPAPFGCGKEIEGFNDELSAREFQISSLCQVCQDKVFGADE